MDSAFVHINGIDMEVVADLLGQEIVKQSTTIADEEAKVLSDRAMLSMQGAERNKLHDQLKALRSDDVKGVAVAFTGVGGSVK